MSGAVGEHSIHRPYIFGSWFQHIFPCQTWFHLQPTSVDLLLHSERHAHTFSCFNVWPLTMLHGDGCHSWFYKAGGLALRMVEIFLEATQEMAGTSKKVGVDPLDWIVSWTSSHWRRKVQKGGRMWYCVGILGREQASWNGWLQFCKQRKRRATWDGEKGW